MQTDPLEILARAIEGLTYPSESDEPFDVFKWDDEHTASAREALVARINTARRIGEISMRQFFEPLKVAEDAQRFRELHAVLKSLLSDCAVVRVGDREVRVDVYLIGRLDARTWAGVHTISVET
jgi:hypothetical protein